MPAPSAAAPTQPRHPRGGPAVTPVPCPLPGFWRAEGLQGDGGGCRPPALSQPALSPSPGALPQGGGLDGTWGARGAGGTALPGSPQGQGSVCRAQGWVFSGCSPPPGSSPGSAGPGAGHPRCVSPPSEHPQTQAGGRAG